MCKKFFQIISCLIFGGLLILAFTYESKHNDKHIKEGYETLGVVQTHTKSGHPKFFKVVRYKDGCEGKIEISASEYFLKKGNN